MSRPRCRYCGARVEYFGQICLDCDPTDPVDEAHDLAYARRTTSPSPTTSSCIVIPGQDTPTLWECECHECRRLQHDANATLQE